MTVRVLLFAQARSATGAAHVDLQLGDRPDVQQIREALAATHPELKSLLDHSAIAVNQRFVGDRTIVGEHDEVAWIPPVSGG